MFEKVYELPISINYVKHWGMAEAIREIIQNALDSDSPFEWEIEGDTLTIRSKFARLEPKTLLLGTTTKDEDKDAIGSFGEGYKIALLVLARQNYDVTIYNHDIIWKPEFRHSKKFEDTTLCVISTNNTEHKEGVTFKISGLSEDDIEQVKNSCLYMQKDIGQVKHTSKGLILFDKPHMLYVGGLFICNTTLDYGYDIKPEFIVLERDRQTVSSFELEWVAKSMWLEIDDYDLVVSLIEKDIPDMRYITTGTTQVVREACYRHFIKKHGDNAIIATNQKELEDLVERGMTNVVVIGGNYGTIIKDSNSYSNSAIKVKQQVSITYDLEQWLEANKKHMRRHAIANFNSLIEASKKWRKV